MSLVFFYFTDNLGRKKVFVVAWTCCLLGIAMTLLVPNIYFVSFGMFLIGFGGFPGYRFTFMMASEQMGQVKRQKMMVEFLLIYCSGVMLISLAFYLMNDWRIITLVFCLIPSVIFYVILLVFFEETPGFLIRSGADKAIEGLNRMARMNGKG